MRQKLERLLELQSAETEIERLGAKLEAVPEKLKALDSEKIALEESLENEKAAMSALKKKYRDMESDVQTNIDYAAKSQDKLTAVKTNKEYQAILKEIDEVREKNSGIEDEMIIYLEQMELAEVELSKKGEHLKRMQVQIDSEKDAIQTEAEEDRLLLENAEKLKQQLDGEVDIALKKDYDQVKKTVKSRAVVPVIKAICQGCHMNIPPQMFNELQRGNQLKFCPHCYRIIYWDDMLE